MLTCVWWANAAPCYIMSLLPGYSVFLLFYLRTLCTATVQVNSQRDNVCLKALVLLFSIYKGTIYPYASHLVNLRIACLLHIIKTSAAKATLKQPDPGWDGALRVWLFEWEALQSVSKTHLWVMLQREWTKVHVGAEASYRDPWEAVDHIS